MFDNLKAEFADLNKSINRAMTIGNYAKALDLIRRANDICKRLYEESTTIEDKDFWKKNNAALKSLADQCKEYLKEQGVVIETAKPKMARIVEKEVSTKQEKEKKEQGEINYIFGEINVKQFLIEDANKNTTFDDVCGMEEEKEFIENEFFLTKKQRTLREELGIQNENFLLLYGVPGTGKTFFATAISNELKKRTTDVDVYFFAIKSSNIKDSKCGATEKNIQAIFEFAKQFERCVLFFDEIEALLPSRNINTGDPTARVSVATFLPLVDGFASSDKVLIIAATNYPEQIDSAVLSRAKEKIEVPLPNKETIYKILDRGIGTWLEKDFDLNQLAEDMIGYSGRDLTYFINDVKKILFNEIKEKNSYDSEYIITKDMINKALSKVKPETLQKDILRIAAFKN